LDTVKTGPHQTPTINSIEVTATTRLQSELPDSTRNLSETQSRIVIVTTNTAIRLTGRTVPDRRYSCSRHIQAINEERHVMFLRSTTFTRRSLAVGATALMAAAALTACTTGGGSAAEDDSPTTGSVEWWGYSPEASIADKYIAAFNEEYPDIEVTYKPIPDLDYTAALRAGLVSPEGPDVYDVATNPVASIEVFGEFALDLKPAMVDLLGEDWQEKTSTLGQQAFYKDDELLAASMGFVSAGVLQINQDLFDEYGLEAPTTLDEWVEVCDTFRAGGVQCFSLGAAFAILNTDFLHSIANSVEPGAWQEASEGARGWDEPWMIESLRIWKDLETVGVFEPGSLGVMQVPDATNKFISGQAAMIQMGTWYTPNTTKQTMLEQISAAGVAEPELFTMVTIPFPDVAGTGAEVARFGDADIGLAVNAKTDYPQASTTFALWLAASDTGQQVVSNQLDQTADRVGFQPDWDNIELVNPEVQRPVLEALVEGQFEITEARFRLLSPALVQALSDATTAVLEGTSTPEEAAAAIQAAAAS
jgi:raffinose/stachyose/melibiose transport system substrate-binding protein